MNRPVAQRGPLPILVLAVCCASSNVILAADTSPDLNEIARRLRNTSFDFPDRATTLTGFARHFTKKTGLPLSFADGDTRPATTVVASLGKNLSAHEALDRAVRYTPYRYYVTGGKIRVIQRSFAEYHARRVLKERLRELPAPSPALKPVFDDKRIVLTERNIELANVLRKIAAENGLPLNVPDFLSPGDMVERCDFNRLGLGQALALLLEPHGLIAVPTADAIRIEPTFLWRDNAREFYPEIYATAPHPATVAGAEGIWVRFELHRPALDAYRLYLEHLETYNIFPFRCDPELMLRVSARQVDMAASDEPIALSFDRFLAQNGFRLVLSGRMFLIVKATEFRFFADECRVENIFKTPAKQDDPEKNPETLPPPPAPPNDF